MEEVGQNPLNDVCKMMEIPNLEVTKQNLDYLNSDLEQDLQKLDEANQILLRKIQEKEETIQSLETEITLSLGRVKEKEELNHIILEKEEALKDLKLESGQLEKRNKLLSRNVAELQKEISNRFQNVGLDQGILKQMLAELKVKVQMTMESCANQEKEMAKVESDYQSVYQLCEDQAHYIKKYQEILRKMEKEKEVLLLEKEISKVQNNSSQIVKPGSILVETIQSDVERTIMKKQKRVFWYSLFRIEYSKLSFGFCQDSTLANTLFTCRSIPEAEGAEDFRTCGVKLQVYVRRRAATGQKRIHRVCPDPFPSDPTVLISLWNSWVLHHQALPTDTSLHSDIQDLGRRLGKYGLSGPSLAVSHPAGLCKLETGLDVDWKSIDILAAQDSLPPRRKLVLEGL